MTNDSGFNLQQWASKERYFATVEIERFSGLVAGRIQGFNKALDLVMEKHESLLKVYPETSFNPNHTGWLIFDQLKAIISKLRGEKPSKLCPCHNEPCVWTSYNQKLWNEPKTDHYSCSVTLKEVE